MKRVLMASIAVLLAAATAPSAAQTQHPTPPTTPAGPVVVDGALAPDRIPNTVALYLFLRTAAIKPDATEHERARTRAILRRANLNEADTEAMTAILTDFGREIQRIEESARRIHDANPDPADRKGPLMALGKQRSALYFATLHRLATQLSPEGAAALKGHVIANKAHMKIHTRAPAQ